MELPLINNITYTHWAQLGKTSQLKLDITLRQTEKLINQMNKLKNIDFSAKNTNPDKQVSAEEAKAKIAAQIQQQLNKSLLELRKKDEDGMEMPLPDKVAYVKKLIH